MKEELRQGLLASAKLKEQMAEECAEKLAEVVECLRDSLKKGGKILLCGNGGSAADCQHIATEIVVRFRDNRAALPAIALTTDTSILTAAANDFGFEQVFARQVEALMKPEDVLLAISTSGNSANIIAAAKQAKEQGGQVIAFTGADGGKLAGQADIVLAIPSETTYLIQEGHQAAYHLMCKMLEESVASS
jgi:D-sedoheptulose 7-phosphate isomerase